MRRSTQRMRELGVKLRHGMTENGIDPQTQEEIVQSISSFALYGFPESHAASFALIAYASAFFKEYYLAAFTCAMLNNQPMGFYSPAVLVKDAQRHGLRVLPIDVQKSSWDCTVEELSDQTKALRLGLRYVRGMRQSSAEVLVRSREEHGAFESSDDLGRRVPALNRKEMVALASIGALNWVGETGHRRDALWQVERVSRRPGPLLQSAEEAEDVSPLERMSWEDRLVADFQGTGLTVGKHPMAYHRSRLARLNISSAEELKSVENGRYVCIAGCVIARQRPGTAKGFIFLSIEDETGIANAIITPQLYEKNRSVIATERFLMVEGKLQNIDRVIHVRAQRVQSLHLNRIAAPSHDFH